MSCALIRVTSAIAAAGLLVASSALPAAASAAQDQTATIPAHDQVSRVIPASEFMAAMVGGLDRGVAEAEAEGGWSMDLSGIGVLVLGSVLALLTYEYEHGLFTAGS